MLTKMKEIMAELLEDEEIQQKISAIARTKNCQNENMDEEILRQIEKLRKENERLTHETERLAQQTGTLKIEKENLKQEAEQLKEEKSRIEREKKGAEEKNNILTGQLERKEQELSQYKTRQTELQRSYDSLLTRTKPVEKAFAIWQEFMELDEAELDFLDRLSGSRSLLAYIALGSDFGRIRQLWNYIRETVRRDEADERVVRVLRDYFDMCIEIYNTVNNRNEKLEKLFIAQGSDFDSEISIKTAKSRLNGTVSEILVNGYRNQDGKVVFQAVVKVE